MRLSCSTALSPYAAGYALFLRDDDDLGFLPLVVAEPSDGGRRDFAASEVLFLLFSRRLSRESRISFSRLFFPQSMMFRTYLRKSK